MFKDQTHIVDNNCPSISPQLDSDSNAFLCLQRPLVPATGRTSRQRPATCCFTPTVSAGAQCKSRHTGRGRYAVVHTASSPAPKERLTLTLTFTVHFMEPQGREYTESLGVALLSQLSAIAGATVYGMQVEKDWCQRTVRGTTADAHL